MPRDPGDGTHPPGDPVDGTHPMSGATQIDLNTASKDDLSQIVPATHLETILCNRPFKSMHDLLRLGIDQKTIDDMEAGGVIIRD